MNPLLVCAFIAPLVVRTQHAYCKCLRRAFARHLFCCRRLYLRQARGRRRVYCCDSRLLQSEDTVSCSAGSSLPPARQGLSLSNALPPPCCALDHPGDCFCGSSCCICCLFVLLCFVLLRAALTFLSSEGHLYSTIDDDHFRSTDDGGGCK